MTFIKQSPRAYGAKPVATRKKSFSKASYSFAKQQGAQALFLRCYPRELFNRWSQPFGAYFAILGLLGNTTLKRWLVIQIHRNSIARMYRIKPQRRPRKHQIAI